MSKKCCFLVWLALHDAFPTASLRHHCGLTMSSVCGHCQVQHEDVLHCLQDCVRAREVWDEFHLEPSFFHHMDFRSWMQHIARRSDIWLVYNILWWVQCHRNWALLNGSFMPKDQLCQLISSDLQALAGDDENTNVTMRLPRLVQQEWPRGDIVKLNVDGTSRGNPSRARFGSLARNVEGIFLFGFQGYFGIYGNLLMKLIETRQRLFIAQQRGFCKVACETDSMEVLHLIKEHVDLGHLFHSVVPDIKQLLQKAWEISVSYILREANMCADWLAKASSAKNRNIVVWEIPPLGLMP